MQFPKNFFKAITCYNVSFRAETKAKESTTKAITLKNWKPKHRNSNSEWIFPRNVNSNETLRQQKIHVYVVIRRYGYRSSRFQTILICQSSHWENYHHTVWDRDTLRKKWRIKNITKFKDKSNLLQIWFSIYRETARKQARVLQRTAYTYKNIHHREVFRLSTSI